MKKWIVDNHVCGMVAVFMGYCLASTCDYEDLVGIRRISDLDLFLWVLLIVGMGFVDLAITDYYERKERLRKRWNIRK